jgi:hypothetical protein
MKLTIQVRDDVWVDEACDDESISDNQLVLSRHKGVAS